MQACSVMSTRCIVIRTDRSGLKVLAGLPRPLPYLLNLIMTSGWERPQKRIILKACCLLTGGDGGTMVPAPSEIWAATSWHQLLRSLAWVILYQPNAASLPGILRTGIRLIIRSAVR